MTTRFSIWPALLLAAAGLVSGPAGVRADTTDNGTFRFLTQSLPVGTTNSEYVARLLTANADGPVTFSLEAGSSLPNGMTLSAATGFITGRPTTTFNQNPTFLANDGTNQIALSVNLKVNAAGGGGNEGSTFGGVPLAPGRVATPYTHTVTVENGVGPYVFGAVAVPPGLRLDGLTGTISGTPTAPGTFFVELSVTDHGENENKGVTVQPIAILPETSDFRFTTSVLNNGEVGTPFYDAWQVADATGAVTFSASGLPAGLSVESSTGVVSGTPTVAGTFEVVLGATDGKDTITTNLRMLVAPSSTSSFYWDFFGIPAALIGTLYERQPPILVAAANGTTATYSATGLPTGITYDALSGELRGTASEVGIYPTVFTATDSTAGTTLVLSLDFVVLPPTGGDAGALAVNLWIAKSKLKAGRPGEDSWTGACIYNADRRTGSTFDPATQALTFSLGSTDFVVPAGSLEPSRAGLAFRTPRKEVPSKAVVLAPSKQTLAWSLRSATIPEAIPGVLRQAFLVGSRGYRVETFVDLPGKLRVPSGMRQAAFVVAKASIAVEGGGKDKVSLQFLLADPAFAYQAATSTLRLRLLDGADALLDRDFTALGTAKVRDDPPVGSTSYKLKGLRDEAAASRVVKFRFDGKNGKGTLVLDALTLPALDDGEAHLGVELTVGTSVYYTSVTFFERRTDSYRVP